MRGHIVEVDVLVAPLEVVDDALVSQLLLHDESVLEKVDDALLDVEVVELGDHGFLVFQVALILVNKGVPLIDDPSNIIKHSSISAHVQAGHLVRHVLVLLLLSLQLCMHILDLDVVALKLSDDHFLVVAPKNFVKQENDLPSESLLNFGESHGDIW